MVLFFYLAFAIVEIDGFEHKNELYSFSAYIILISVVIHGFTAPSITEYFKRKMEQDENESGEKPKE